MQISDNLLCLFNSTIEERDGEYVVTVPEREIESGSIDPDAVYRIAVLTTQPESHGTTSTPDQAPAEPQPPVEIGEIRYVEIEDIGKQGDGIARVERGYVIIVPGAEMGEQVKIEIAEVKSNFAVGEVLEEDLL